MCLSTVPGNVTETTALQEVVSESKDKSEERLMSNSKVDVTSYKEDMLLGSYESALRHIHNTAEKMERMKMKMKLTK